MRRVWLAIVAAVAFALPRPAYSQPPAGASEIPRVLLTETHAKHCRVKQGDSFPALELPQLGGQTTALPSLYGQQATVVVFWTPDRWMARAALADLATLLSANNRPAGVAVVGIAVRKPSGVVQAEIAEAKAAFPQLLDAEGQAFAQVGDQLLPRIFVLDAQGKIVWFDVEYSEATRRELRQSLAALTTAK